MRLCLIAVLLAAAAFAQQPHPSVSLSWNWAQGTKDAATGFHVQRANITGGPYTTIATVPIGATGTYLDTTVVAGGTYYYIVTAFNAGGESGTPEVVCIVPFQAPQAPSGLSGAVK